jgi:hypothetical protein
MINTVEITKLLEKVVVEEFPNEALVYALRGEKMIADAVAKRSSFAAEESKSTKLGAADIQSLKEVLQITPLVAATIAAALDLVHKYKVQQLERKQAELAWAKRLREAGLSPQKSLSVAEKYGQELLDALPKPIEDASVEA